MNESNQIRLLLVITLGLALAINVAQPLDAFEGDAVVSDYSAVFYSDGTLEETFTYKINVEGKRFLFRFWEDQLSTSPLQNPHILLVDIEAPANTIRYVKDYAGQFSTLDETSYNTEMQINSLAYRNEAGAFRPEGYTPGEYMVKYTFKIKPPLEVDDENVHLNLKLASVHLPYEKVRVAFEDPGYIVKSYSHPPTLRKTTDMNMIVFSGSSGEDQLLEFEFLMTHGVLDILEGDQRMVQDVESLTVNANRVLWIEYMIASLSIWVMRLAGFVMPIGLYMIWNRVGKEKDYVVPRTLSVVPNKDRAAWIVNLVFKSDAADFDEDGFYATLLDLHIKEKIRISTEETEATIEILDDQGLDRYEDRVMDFLSSIAVNDVVSPQNMNEMAERGKSNSVDASRLGLIQAKYSKLTTSTDEKVAKEFTVNGKKELVMPAALCLMSSLILAGAFTVSPNANWVFFKALVYSLIPLLQVIIAALFPTTLFGYWKDDNLREKLQWDAFKAHLSDFSQLDRYGPEDINMWGRWLVYGTALGVGDKVAEAMNMLEVDYAPVRFVPTYYYWFRPITTARLYGSSRSGSGGSGGGGFGGGGGMGGGGGGVR
ncbi:MAG: DUF2207 domain-containing protein [Candidatus Bathyarchaeota archaeon]